MIDFKDKTVIVTGASSGIGAAMARQFASRGAVLFLAARNQGRLDAVKKDCEELGSPRVRTFIVDMESQESMDAFVETMGRETDSIDALILNAGITQRSLTFETDFSVDKRIMEVDYFGPVYLTKKLASYIQKASRVSIAVTSSTAGIFGFPLRSAYCAAKHALIGFFEALDIENPNTRVTVLVPGRINTPISRSALLGDGSANRTMDPGQANGMDVEKCARRAVRAIARSRRRRYLGGADLIMVPLKKFCPSLFYLIAGKVSPR